MAKSPSHKWGQIIGDFMEATFERELHSFAMEHGLYLDKQGHRKARNGKKVAWVDGNGNTHDLDFVLERGGTDATIGNPIAFIECAWRRYTKHSRNKSQEIQGAILPLVATHRNHAPFIGVVLAGEFTDGAISQLKSLGFSVLYFPYHLIVQAFAKYGIDAAFGEDTSAQEFEAKISAWEKLRDKEGLSRYLMELNQEQVDPFLQELGKSVSRFIVSVRILALHGNLIELASIQEALHFVDSYKDAGSKPLPLRKYEITIKYNNGDKVEGSFRAKEEAVSFLSSYAPPKAK